MAAVCDICGKKPSFGMNVSHSHRRTKRRWDPNIQRVRAVVDGAPKRLHVCTSCIRAGKVTKPLRRTHEPAATNWARARSALGVGRGWRGSVGADLLGLGHRKIHPVAAAPLPAGGPGGTVPVALLHRRP